MDMLPDWITRPLAWITARPTWQKVAALVAAGLVVGMAL